MGGKKLACNKKLRPNPPLPNPQNLVSLVSEQFKIVGNVTVTQLLKADRIIASSILVSSINAPLIRGISSITANNASISYLSANKSYISSLSLDELNVSTLNTYDNYTKYLHFIDDKKNKNSAILYVSTGTYVNKYQRIFTDTVQDITFDSNIGKLYVQLWGGGGGFYGNGAYVSGEIFIDSTKPYSFYVGKGGAVSSILNYDTGQGSGGQGGRNGPGSGGGCSFITAGGNVIVVAGGGGSAVYDIGNESHCDSEKLSYSHAGIYLGYTGNGNNPGTGGSQNSGGVGGSNPGSGSNAGNGTGINFPTPSGGYGVNLPNTGSGPCGCTNLFGGGGGGGGYFGGGGGGSNGGGGGGSSYISTLMNPVGIDGTSSFTYSMIPEYMNNAAIGGGFIDSTKQFIPAGDGLIVITEYPNSLYVNQASVNDNIITNNMYTSSLNVKQLYISGNDALYAIYANPAGDIINKYNNPDSLNINNFIIPPNVDNIYFKIWGAGGGYYGNGAFIYGKLKVTPGETLTIIVGTGGKASKSSSPVLNDTNAIGGASYPGNGPSHPAILAGPQGGTYSAILNKNGVPLVIAGAGGGAAYGTPLSCNPYCHGGIIQGYPGNDNTNDCRISIGGSGGTQSTPGIGGGKNMTRPNTLAGDNAIGHTGGNGSAYKPANGYYTGAGGGGGGSGFYGGGGGGGDVGTGGGGGGGSSFINTEYVTIISALDGINSDQYVNVDGYEPGVGLGGTYIDNEGLRTGKVENSITTDGGNGLVILSYNKSDLVLYGGPNTFVDMQNIRANSNILKSLNFNNPKPTNVYPDESPMYVYDTVGQHEFTIPYGVSNLYVQLWGAGGGSGNFNNGGNGAYVSGYLSVTPGDSLQISVGEAGKFGKYDTFGGGGISSNGYSGGGRSAIRINNATNDGTQDLVTAGGGGGGSFSEFCAGGSAGIYAGYPGSYLISLEAPYGSGGLYSLGGAGGIGVSSYRIGVTTSSIFSGVSGIKYKGGDGVIVFNSNSSRYYISTINNNGGGGGGGGYYGGGGGGQGLSTFTEFSGALCTYVNTSVQIGGAGGGGSSYIDNLINSECYDGLQSNNFMSVNGYKNNAGLRNNDGLVILSYEVNLNLEYTDSKTSFIVRETAFPVAGWVAGNYQDDTITTNSMVYSTDGSNWNPILQGGFTGGNYVQTNGLHYNGSLWGAVGPTVDNISTASIQTSVDGIFWNNIYNGGFLNYGTGITYNTKLNLWIATGNTNTALGSIQYSKDGSNFNNISLGGFSIEGTGLAYSFNGLNVATGKDTTPKNSIQYSSNSISWFPAITGGFDTSIGYGVATNELLWVAAGKTNGISQSTLQYSIDGCNWSCIKKGGFKTAAYGVGYGNGVWVAVGDIAKTFTNKNVYVSPTSTIQYSLDGSNWNSAKSGGFVYSGYSIRFNGKYWIAGGSSDDSRECLQYSMDGSNWYNSSNINIDGYVSIYAVSPGNITYPINNMVTSITNKSVKTENIITNNFSNNNLYGNYIQSVNANIDNLIVNEQTANSFRTSNANIGDFYTYSYVKKILVEPLQGFIVTIGSASSTSNSIQHSINNSNWYSATKGGFSPYLTYTPSNITSYTNPVGLLYNPYISTFFAYGNTNEFLDPNTRENSNIIQYSTDASNWNSYKNSMIKDQNNYSYSGVINTALTPALLETVNSVYYANSNYYLLTSPLSGDDSVYISKEPGGFAATSSLTYISTVSGTNPAYQHGEIAEPGWNGPPLIAAYDMYQSSLTGPVYLVGKASSINVSPIYHSGNVTDSVYYDSDTFSPLARTQRLPQTFKSIDNDTRNSILFVAGPGVNNVTLDGTVSTISTVMYSYNDGVDWYDANLPQYFFNVGGATSISCGIKNNSTFVVVTGISRNATSTIATTYYSTISRPINIPLNLTWSSASSSGSGFSSVIDPVSKTLSNTYMGTTSAFNPILTNHLVGGFANNNNGAILNNFNSLTNRWNSSIDLVLDGTLDFPLVNSRNKCINSQTIINSQLITSESINITGTINSAMINNKSTIITSTLSVLNNTTTKNLTALNSTITNALNVATNTNTNNLNVANNLDVTNTTYTRYLSTTGINVYDGVGRFTYINPGIVSTTTITASTINTNVITATTFTGTFIGDGTRLLLGGGGASITGCNLYGASINASSFTIFDSGGHSSSRFNGNGGGLTGTAAGLTVGRATSADAATTLITGAVVTNAASITTTNMIANDIRTNNITTSNTITVETIQNTNMNVNGTIFINEINLRGALRSFKDGQEVLTVDPNKYGNLNNNNILDVKGGLRGYSFNARDSITSGLYNGNGSGLTGYASGFTAGNSRNASNAINATTATNATNATFATTAQVTNTLNPSLSYTASNLTVNTLTSSNFSFAGTSATFTAPLNMNYSAIVFRNRLGTVTTTIYPDAAAVPNGIAIECIGGIKATKFIGDGSQLTGITSSSSGINPTSTYVMAGLAIRVRGDTGGGNMADLEYVRLDNNIGQFYVNIVCEREIAARGGFYGPGTRLSGTANNLTAGTANVANALNTSNTYTVFRLNINDSIVGSNKNKNLNAPSIVIDPNMYAHFNPDTGIYCGGKIIAIDLKATGNLKVDGNIKCDGTITGSSDQRIKKDIHTSSDTLETVNSIQLRSYKYVDETKPKVSHGVIAQELQKVYPEAVQVNEDYLPNINRNATSVTKNTDNTLTITLDIEHNLQVQDTIKVIINKESFNRKLVSIVTPFSFIIEPLEMYSSEDTIFVYGKLVKDFLTIDYSKLGVLAVGAIQTLSKQVSALQEENKQLKEQINEIFRMLKK